MAEARRRLNEFSELFGKSAPKAVAWFEEGFDDAIAVMTLPDKYRKRLRTTSGLLVLKSNESQRKDKIS